MTQLTLAVRVERWPVAGAFTIARGAKTHVDVVVVEATGEGVTGRGEATPIYYHGETAVQVEQLVESLGEVSSERSGLAERLGRGAARNGVDCALWDWEARRTGVPAWQRAGLAPPQMRTTAFTISLGTPERMEADARAAAGLHPLLKLKLAGEGDDARVAAVRRGAPEARLIVDANEAWTDRDVLAEASALLRHGVELIEQPVKAGADHLLDGIRSPIPLCADESCQDRSDLARCVGRYDAVNIKLDKAGGLSEALLLAREARASGLEIMVGCMLSTSLGVAPAFLLAQEARWIDLDGPLLLAEDRPAGFRFEGGSMHPLDRGFWGE
jgi:L-alanine-DL-glutamate epimerase-like enolase superfamily enzyme